MTLTIGPSVELKDGRPMSRKEVMPLSQLRLSFSSFTLLELVLVMLVICWVLGMAAVSLRGFFASRQTTEAAAQIVALTQFARTQAVAEGRVYRLNFDTEDGKYWLTAQTGGAFVPLSSEFGRIFYLPAGTGAEWATQSEAASRGYVSFYPDGRTEPAKIRLTGRQGEIVDILCESPAERFRVVPMSEVSDK